jgi:hypothetical protein
VTPFEHLAVLISIVLGLGITQLLTNVHRLVQARRRVRLYWLPVVWTALLFIAAIEWWWAAFALRQNARWTNFFYFLFVLLSPVTLFLAAAFVLPEGDGDESRVIDLRHYYYENRGAFFAMLAASPALDAVRRGLEAGRWTDFGAVSNAVSALFIATLVFSRRAAWHAIVTVLVGGLFLYFIVSSALQLR